MSDINFETYMEYSSKYYDCPSYFDYINKIVPCIMKHKGNAIVINNFYTKFTLKSKKILLFAKDSQQLAIKICDELAKIIPYTNVYRNTIQCYFRIICELYEYDGDLITNSSNDNGNDIYALIEPYSKLIYPINAHYFMDLVELEENILRDGHFFEMNISPTFQNGLDKTELNKFINRFRKHGCLFTGMYAYNKFMQTNEPIECLEILTDNISQFVDKAIYHDMILNIFGNYYELQRNGKTIIRIFHITNACSKDNDTTNIHGTILSMIFNTLLDMRYYYYFAKLLRMPRESVFQEETFGSNISEKPKKQFNYLPKEFRQIIYGSENKKINNK